VIVSEIAAERNPMNPHLTAPHLGQPYIKPFTAAMMQPFVRLQRQLDRLRADTHLQISRLELPESAHG
jgi:hypothetical protein